MRAEERDLVLAHHDELRRVVDELERLVSRLAPGDEHVAVAVLEHSRLLHRRLCQHAKFEDAVLGSGTCGRGHPAHREQCEWLGAALVRASRDAAGAAELAGAVRPLVYVLREAMAHEERDLLGPRNVDEDSTEGELDAAGRAPQEPSLAAEDAGG